MPDVVYLHADECEPSTTKPGVSFCPTYSFGARCADHPRNRNGHASGAVDGSQPMDDQRTLRIGEQETAMKYQVARDLNQVEYEALKTDIEERGVMVPVELDEDGNVLDGHHRVRICAELGIADYPTIVRKGLTEEQKFEHARKLNANRRHMSKEERDETMRAMRADGMTYQQIADKVGVNVATAHRAAADVPILHLQNEKGQTRPATYERKPDPEPLPTWVTQSSVTAAVIEEDEEPEPEPTPAPLPVRPPRPTREPEPIPAALPDAVTIHHADARNLASLGIDPVHLVITSPPYNVGIDYATHDDNMTEDDYHDLLFDVFGQCWQVMEDGARIAVIVPFGVGRNPWIPVPPTIYTLLKAAGFTLRGQIIWDKNTTGNRTSWGSFRLSSNPAIRDTTEAIIVAHKGSGNLVVPDAMRGVDGKGTYTAALADSDYFMELAQDHWVVAPESAQRVGHPAPFPVELAKRLIDFYAHPGAHILDPFGGSGSTGLAALNAGCRATLVEIDSEYCRLAKGRLTK